MIHTSLQISVNGFDFLIQYYLPLKPTLQKAVRTVAEYTKDTREAILQWFPLVAVSHVAVRGQGPNRKKRAKVLSAKPESRLSSEEARES